MERVTSLWEPESAMSDEERRVVPEHGGHVDVTIHHARSANRIHPPLVLVPGVGGPRETFHHQVEALSVDRNVISTTLNQTQAQGVEPIDSASRDILAVVDALGVEIVDVLGHSFGSCATARFTELHPERVRRQVWVSPPIVHHAPWRAAFGPGWFFGGAILKFTPERHRAEVVRRIAESRTYSTEPDLSEAELTRLAERVSDTDFSPFFRRFSGLRDWDWRRLHAPAPRPTLVVQGEKEHKVTPRSDRRALEMLSERPIGLIPGTHMPYLSFPREFNELVHSWLSPT